MTGVPDRIPFGPATITVGEGEDALKFDGKEYLQVEGGELTLTPSFTDETYVDFGETVVNRYLTGWEGTLTFAAGQENMKIFKLALSATKPITDTTSSEEVGFTDAKIGTALSDYARKVVIHPRSKPDNDKSSDITIYQMVASGDFTKTYTNEQGSLSIELSMIPRQGFDASKDGNFFYFGPVDPNAVVTP